MSWHYSRAAAEAFSEENSSGGGQSALLRKTTTSDACSCNGKMTEFSIRFRSGTMSKRSTVASGEGSSTSSRLAFPVRTSARSATAPDSMERTPDCGLRRLASFAKFCPISCGWKIPQKSLFEGSIKFSGIFPKWGSMRSGVLYRRPSPSGLKGLRKMIIREIVSGYSGRVPTVAARHDALLSSLPRAASPEWMYCPSTR